MDHFSGDAIEGSFNDNDLSHPIDLPVSLESSKAVSVEQHDLSENKTVKSLPAEVQQDMFFSCADWEATALQKQASEQLLAQEAPEAPQAASMENFENFSDSDEEGIPEMK
jgi:hypothetical protein